MQLRLITLVLAAAATCWAQQPGRILTYEEYNRLSVRPPYILTLAGEKGTLLYFGVEHTNDPAHPQFAQLEKLWKEFRPTLVLTEGGVWPLLDGRDEAIRRLGEQGLVRILANRDRLPVRTLEPPREDEVAELLRHFTAERVKLFYVLRQVTQHREMKKPEPIEEYVSTQLRQLSATAGLEGPPRTLAEFEATVARNFDRLPDWRQIPRDWLIPPRNDTWTNEVSRRSSEFRDQRMVKLLVDQVKKGERVLAVAGFSHVVVQEPALRFQIKSSPQSHQDTK